MKLFSGIDFKDMLQKESNPNVSKIIHLPVTKINHLSVVNKKILLRPCRLARHAFLTEFSSMRYQFDSEKLSFGNKAYL
ncbi:hypothetical protein T02_732 [Trichinella nativa]|uniref:Uncharacterized protein n=1 Tax=Trichinella nativa TaxID=6335 RepID=A0A0V1L6C7_9BILA|nr:hypothetical protein T02_732 [Trichinella nativa]